MHCAYMSPFATSFALRHAAFVNKSGNTQNVAATKAFVFMQLLAQPLCHVAKAVIGRALGGVQRTV